MVEGGVPGAPEERETHRGLARRLGFALAVLIGVVATIIVLTIVGARLYFSDARLAELVPRTLTNALRGTFAVERVRVRFVPLGAELFGVSIRDPSGREVVRAQHVDATLDPWPLLHQRVHLETARVVVGTVTLYPPGPRPPHMGEPPAVSLLECFEPRHPGPPGGAPSPWSVKLDGLSGDGLVTDVRFGGTRATFERISVSEGFVSLSPPSPTSTATTTGFLLHAVLEAGLARVSTGTVAEGPPDPLGNTVFGPMTVAADGSPTRLALHVGVRATAPEIAGVKLDALALQLHLDRGQAVLETFELAHGAGRLRARGHIDAPFPSPARVVTCLFGSLPESLARATCALAQHLEVEMSALPLPALLGRFVDPKLLPESVTGTVALDGVTVAGRDHRLSFDVSATGVPRALARGIVSRARIRGTARLRARGIELDPLLVDAKDLGVRITGLAPWRLDGPLALHASALDRAPGAVLRAFGVPVTASRAVVELEARGSVLDPRAEGMLTVSDARGPRGLPEADVRVPFRFDDGTVFVDRAIIDTGEGELRVRGRVKLFRLPSEGQPPERSSLDPPQGDGGLYLVAAKPRTSRPKLELKGLEPLRVPEVEGEIEIDRLGLGPLTGGVVEGRISGVVDIARGPRGLAGVGRFAGTTLFVRGSTLAVRPFEVSSFDQRITVRELVVTPAGGRAVRIAGEADLGARTVDARVRTIDLPLASLAGALHLPPDLEGELSLGGAVRGSFDALAITATVTADALAFGGASLGTLTGTISGDPTRFSGTIVWISPAGRVGIDAAYWPKEQRIDARARGEAIALESLPGLAGRTPITGVLSLELTALGALPWPAIDGAVTFEHLAMGGEPLLDGRAHVGFRTDDDGARIRVTADALGAVHASGFVARRAEGPSKERGAAPERGLLASPLDGALDVELEPISLAAILPSLRDRGLDVRTRGRGSVSLGGAPRAVRGEVELPELDVQLGSEHLEAPVPIRLAWDGRTLDIRDLVLRGASGTFEARGSVGPSLDVGAHGDLALAFLAPLVPGIARATGRATIQLHVGGTTDAPLPEGELVVVRPVTFRPRGSVRDVSLDSGRISFANGEVRLSELAGSLGGGAFRGSGALRLEGFAPVSYRAVLDGTALPVRIRDLFVETNAHIVAAGDRDGGRVSGELDIIRGRYQREFRLEQFTFIAGKKADEEPAELPAWLSDVVLDIHAASAGPINVRVDAQALKIELEASADVAVRGTIPEPRVEGRALVEGGTLSFPASKLSLTEGAVDFVPEEDVGIRPVVDLTAEGELPRRADQVYSPRVTLTLRGPLDAVTVDATSDAPELERPELLSVLLTGRTFDEIISGRSTVERGPTIDSRLAFAGSQLAPIATRQLESLLQEALNLQLQLQTELSADRFRVTASREVSTRLRIEGGYERSLTMSASATSARALLFLSSSLFIQGSAETVSAAPGAVLRDLEAGTSGRLELQLRVLGR